MFAWTGAALFLASLGHFLFSYGIRFGEPVAGPFDPAAAAVDIALFSAFALHHSLFARTPIRQRVQTALGGLSERSFYVWVASLLLIVVCALWQPVAGVVWQVPAAVAWLPPLVQLAGVWLTLRSAAAIDIWSLAGVRAAPDASGTPSSAGRGQGAPDANGDTQEFKTDGPYGWVRHPIYLGWFLLVFSVGTMTMTRFVFAVTSAVYILIAMPFEEGTLRRTAPEAYGAYMRIVRWRLVPYLY